MASFSPFPRLYHVAAIALRKSLPGRRELVYVFGDFSIALYEAGSVTFLETCLLASVISAILLSINNACRYVCVLGILSDDLLVRKAIRITFQYAIRP